LNTYTQNQKDIADRAKQQRILKGESEEGKLFLFLYAFVVLLLLVLRTFKRITALPLSCQEIDVK